MSNHPNFILKSLRGTPSKMYPAFPIILYSKTPEMVMGINAVYVNLFVLRFYGPVNPMGSCRAWSVYLTTCLLGRLSPLSR